MRVGVSVCVIACDEADVLERCLDAVSFADEIVVIVDDKSRDQTEQLARRRAAHVERRAYSGDLDQKRACVERAKHDWVLIVDPDEVVSPSLARSIQRTLVSAESDHGDEAGPSAYEVDRVTFHLGRWIRHGDFYPDWKLRLFRRSCARFVGRDPHGRVEVDGRVGRLTGELEHYSYRDLGDQIARIQFFSDQAAAALDREGARFRLRDLIARPPARFLRSYALNAGFRDGVPGFVIAVASAFYVFLKYAKLWERRRVDPGGAPFA